MVITNQNRIFFSSIGAILAITASNIAMAQAVPSSIEPGHVEQRNKTIEAPNVSAAPLITTEDMKPRKGDTSREAKFELKSVTIEGDTDYSGLNLDEIYKEYIGKQVSLSTMQNLADKITVKLRNDGYVLSRAIVPSQKVKGGHVVIRVVGGAINNVIIEGDVKGDPALVQAYADKIRNQKPLNIKTLERYLLLTEDLPGVTAKGVLRPSSVPGASDLVIQLQHKYIEGAIGADNRGGRYLGPYQANGSVKLNSVLGLYEQTAIRGNITAEPEELKYVEIDHQEQIGKEGTKLDIAAAYTKTHPANNLKDFDIEGESKSIALKVSHPFIRSRAENLFGDIGFTYRDVESSSPVVLDYQDNIRALALGGAYDFVDPWQGINRVDLHYSHGFDIEADNGAHSRANAQQEYNKFNFEATHLRNIYGNVSVELRGSGQYSNDSLFASEEFGIGGLPIGSAYDPFEISGDQGIDGRAELQYNASTQYKYLPSYQPYVFYDAGKVWNKDITAGEYKDAALTSTGLGMRFNIATQLSGGVEAAFPISRDVQAEGDKDPRFFFNLAYIF